jgi:hypothetical protein
MSFTMDETKEQLFSNVQRPVFGRRDGLAKETGI